MEKIAAKYLFFSVEEGILIRNYLRNPIKMVLMLFNYGFRGKMVVFVVKKVKKQSYSRICYFGGGVGGGGCNNGGSGLGGGGGSCGGGCVGGDSDGGGSDIGGNNVSFIVSLIFF